MGHAVHFLRRIERLSPAQADLALTLYREPELVEHVLGRMRLPDGAERVALALEDAPAGPHVIVTRDGRFVTCLGAGMTVNDCPVVSRPQIDHASEKIAAMRATLAAGQNEFKRTLRRLMERGSGLSREDFTTLAALMPLISKELLLTAIDVCDYLKRFHKQYYRSRYRKLTPATRDSLQHYWASSWALGHLAALCGERADDVMAHPRVGEEVLRKSLMLMLAGTGLTNNPALVLRGVWAVARAGRPLLGEMRARMHASCWASESLLAGMALSTMAMRHRRLHGEVIKVLARYRRSTETSESVAPAHGVTKELVRLLERQLTEPDAQQRMRADHLRLGRTVFVRYTEYLPEGTPLRCTRPEDVPEQLALAAAMHVHDEMVEYHAIVLAVLMLPWLATASGPALYLPAQIIDQGKTLFDPERLVKLLELSHADQAGAQPARAQARTGRNEPCPCGSGKKYKRCCGAAA